jgi:hypothetical protein
VKLYVHDDSREEELEEGETLGSLRRGAGSTDHADGAYAECAGGGCRTGSGGGPGAKGGGAMASCLLLLA